MQPEEYNNNDITLSYNLVCPYTSFNDAKKDVENAIGEHFYIYSEKEHMLSSGLANTLLRTVDIDKNIITYWKSYQHYVFVLAHELTHIKYICGDETYTNYMAVTALYESGNDYFKNIALWKANSIIYTHDKTEYDCGKQLIDYFTEKGVLNGNK